MPISQTGGMVHLSFLPNRKNSGYLARTGRRGERIIRLYSTMEFTLGRSSIRVPVWIEAKMSDFKPWGTSLNGVFRHECPPAKDWTLGMPMLVSIDGALKELVKEAMYNKFRLTAETAYDEEYCYDKYGNEISYPVPMFNI